jgi:hypothetical protein
VAAAFLGCQNDVTESTTTEGLDTFAIQGYVKDAWGSGIADANVEWYMETPTGMVLIGYYYGTDATGFYGIDWESAWTAYKGKNLSGVAWAPEYDYGYAYITNFQPDDIPYLRDFTLYPE